MKVLLIHNFHRKGSASGDDQVYKNEISLLESHGHTVIKYTISNDEFDQLGIIRKIISTLGMLWSFDNYKSVKNICKEKRPNIVHIHTFFPLLSPSIFYAAKRSGIKVIVTLHDTRFICPCATSLRGTQLCNECGDGHYFRMCKYKCFKNSRLQSLIIAFIFKYHRIRKSFYKQIDKYICLNENQIKLLLEIGFDPKKIVKKYNFVPDKKTHLKPIKIEYIPDRYVVFYGRIGEEKGIRILMKIWDIISDIPLVIMGSGPLENELQSWAKNKEHVYFLGYIENSQCLSIVENGAFVVFPSIWYEGCSMVEIEAESLGKALIATDIGFSIEVITNGINGYRVPLGNVDGFVEKISDLWNKPELCQEMGKNARKHYEENYLPEDNYFQLLEIYKELG